MHELLRLAGAGHAEAAGLRAELPLRAFALRSAGPGAPMSLAEYRAGLLRRSLSLTLLAGSASRWKASLAAARAAGSLSGAAADFDPERPRGLFPVRNFLGAGGLPKAPEAIPVAAYALRAVSGLGGHVVAIRGWEGEIRAEALSPLGLDDASWRFSEQAAPYGKPLGHGDAAWQCRGLWRDADYLVTNFGGDASSRFTAETALLVLDALRSAGEELDLLVPAAAQPAPAYPIVLDEAGRPRSFGHAKLSGGRELVPGSATGAYTNVGVRVYRAAALAAALEELRERHWVEGRGYAIPGNDPAGAEMALDNADALLAERGRARILAFARPEELTPLKSLEDLPAFERAAAKVAAEDAGLLPLLGAR